MRQYERITQLNDREVHDLRNEIYKITYGHFKIWGLGAAMVKKSAPYFHGSHINVLLAFFSNSRLALTHEGFVKRNENSDSIIIAETAGDEDPDSTLTREQMDNSDPASPLMTEDTRNEAVKRGINPNGWITQLFFAPHYEFLDTFNPVQFFKSHSEQSLGQAIGIVLIWGAMVATMIGAPFGADLLISGDPTTHLGLDIFGSMLGALSIISGIHLNKLKQFKHNFTKVEKIFLSITYLSYFPNFLVHHFYNILSNLTRPLGRWRLGSLTLPKTFPASEKEPTLTALIKSINLRREQEKKTEEKLKSEKEKAQIQEAREYQLKLIAEKFGHFDEQDPFYREIREIFDSLVNVLKENGRLDKDRIYELVLYNSNEVNAAYWTDSDTIILSMGLLQELNLFLGGHIGKDHVAAVLAHELEHSLQNFDSVASNWSDKKGNERKKEYDADIESLFTSDAAGFNPNAMLDIMNFFIHFENIEIFHWGYVIDGEIRKLEDFITITFLDAHPPSIDRRSLLSGIVQDKNVLFLNTEKGYKKLELPPRGDSFYERFFQMRTIQDLTKMMEEFDTITVFLLLHYILSWGEDHYPAGWSGVTERWEDALDDFTTNIKDLWRENELKPFLLNTLRTRYPHLNETQIEIFYEAQFGSLFGHATKNANVSEEFSSRIQRLVHESGLTTKELEQLYLDLSAKSPIVHSDFPRIDEIADGLGQLMNDQFTFPQCMNFVLFQVAQKLESTTILAGLKYLIKRDYHYYENRSKSRDLFGKMVRDVLTRDIHSIEGLKKFIENFHSVFGNEATLKDEFYEKFAAILVRENSVYQQMPVRDQIRLIHEILSDKTENRNRVLALYWDTYKERVQTAPINERTEILLILIRSVDHSDPAICFFDDRVSRGTNIHALLSKELLQISGGTNIHALLSKELLQTLRESENGREKLSPKEKNAQLQWLIENDAVPYYQDMIRHYGEALQQADAEDYLEVAKKIKEFMRRNPGALRRNFNHIEPEIVDYHDTFILAYFLKKLKIPFTFYMFYRVTSDDEINIKRITPLPLMLEILYKLSGANSKDVLRVGSDIFENSVSSDKSFTLYKLMMSLLEKNRTSLSVDDISFLAQNMVSKNTLAQWMTLLYPFIKFNGSDILKVIKYLAPVEVEANNPKLLSSWYQNPLSLAKAIRNINFDTTNKTSYIGNYTEVGRSVGTRQDVSHGFQIWGNREFKIDSIEELRKRIKDLDRHFPNPSPLKSMEAEKMFVTLLSSLTRLPYGKRSIEFSYKVENEPKRFSYTGFTLSTQLSQYQPSSNDAIVLMEAFDTVYPILSPEQRDLFGKLIYKILKNTPELEPFQSALSHLELLDALFPYYSKAKDSFIYEILEAHRVSKEDYLTAQAKITRFAYREESEDINNAFFGLELLRALIKKSTAEERKELLLWLITSDDRFKPTRIQTLEKDNNIILNELIDLFWSLTDLERTDFLEEFLKGENGLFEVDYIDSETGNLRDMPQEAKKDRKNNPYIQFEDLIRELITTRLAAVFNPEELKLVRGLLTVKFKAHSPDRRIQLLNGLLSALKEVDAEQNKGDVIVAMVEHGGIPLIKLFQILAQRKVFVRLEQDVMEGEKLNRRIGEVKSNVDPIRKATLFSILEAAGLLGIVATIGDRLGSASIRQVNRVHFKEPITVGNQQYEDGALKVKRPAALKHLEEDFRVMQYMLEYFNAHYPAHAFPKALLGQVRQAVEEELDFKKEAIAQRTFRTNMGKRKSKLRVPQSLLSPEVVGEDPLLLIDEMIHGSLLKDLPQSEELNKIYYELINELFAQIFKDGFFHADPHDGNVLVSNPEEAVLVDLGAHGEVNSSNRKTLFRIMEALAMNNSKTLLQALGEYEGVIVTPEISEDVISLFRVSKTHEERFQRVFELLTQSDVSMPHSLFMFFQLMSKIGKYFDPIKPMQKLGLFSKYKVLSSTDILEPLVQPQTRMHHWRSSALYYIFVAWWEESLYRWGGLVGLPILLSSLGFEPIVSLIPGIVLSLPGFLFSHTIVRWIAKRNSGEWLGWKLEFKKDFISSRTSLTLLYNILFLSVLIFQPASISPALGAVVILHFIKDMVQSYSQTQPLDYKDQLAKDITFIAEELNTPQEKLKLLLSDHSIFLPRILNSALNFWTKESNDPELCLIDLNSARDKNDLLMILRMVQQVEEQKKKNPLKERRYLVIGKSSPSVKDIERLLGISEVWSVLDNREQAIGKISRLFRSKSFSLMVLTTHVDSMVWSRILDGLYPNLSLKILIPEVLDVTKEISLSLVEIGGLNPSLKNWAENLADEGKAVLEQGKIIIQGIPLEPPSREEELKINRLYQQQA